MEWYDTLMEQSNKTRTTKEQRRDAGGSGAETHIEICLLSTTKV